MKPLITVLTLGVDDLQKSVDFDRRLGFETEGIIGTEFEYGAVAFFPLSNQLRLALWPRKSLSHDTGLPSAPACAAELSIGHNVVSKTEVDSAMSDAQAAGAVVVKPAADTFWGGYAGCFQDPDGHLWEVAWNPAWT